MTMPVTASSQDPTRTNSTSTNEKPIDLDALKEMEQQAQLVAWTMERFTAMRNARVRLERKWYMNLAFYHGQQNVQWVAVQGQTSKLNIPSAPPWRVRLISNKIRPIVRTELAKVTAQKPTASVLPASSDDDDQSAARAAEQVWDSFYRRKKVKTNLRRAMFWTLLTGTGYLKVWWDKEAADLDSGQLGDICLSPESPFNIFVPDLREEELEEQPYLIHASTKSAEWVKARYAHLLGDRNVNANVSGTQGLLEDSFLQLTGTTESRKDSVLMLEVWIKPAVHPMFPEGGMYTILGGEVIQAIKGWPYQHGQYPFIKFSHVPTGNYYSDCVVSDLIPLQREYNRTRSQIIEAKNRMAKPQLIAPKGSINAKQITTEPGQVIFYQAGFQPPQPLQLQGLPNYVLEELNRIQMDMDDISGQHEVTKGRVPPGVSAATAISYLQEQDDSKLAHTIDVIEDGMEKLGSQVLNHAIQFWGTDRTIKVVGKDGSFDAISLLGSDLRGNTDIKVESGSALPTSKAAKQAYIMDLMKMGFVDPQVGLEMLEIGGVDKLFDQLQTDLRQVQRENLRMQQGMQIEVNTWDDHQAHINLHNKFRKSQTFEMLPDEIKMIVEAHVQMHTQVAQAQAMGLDPFAVAAQQPMGDPNAPPGAVDPNANGGNAPPMDPTMSAEMPQPPEGMF